MRTTTQQQDKNSRSVSADAGAQDAITLLTEDHQKVKSLFEQYESLGARAHVSKQKLAQQICTELTKHAAVEEEIFYPAVRAAVKKDDMMDEALVEHASVKDLIAQILSMEPGDDLYDAKVKVLGEQVNHHVEEEESQIFPAASKAKLDLDALGAEIAARKEEVELPPH
jgi:hemerythrin superfamily protein